MAAPDLLILAAGALQGHRLRTFLSMLGIAIGVCSVILLTSIGEGTRLYVLDQFTQFGTNIIAVNPGKEETIGIPGVLGGTTKKLTIDDAEALAKLPGVEGVSMFSLGSGRVEAEGRGRSVFIYGTTEALTDVLQFKVRVGNFLPGGDPRRGGSVAVLGPKLKWELFGEVTALGKFVRVGGQRFRVIGIMEPKGEILGMDMDDVVYVPVAQGLKLFNTDELFEIDVIFSHGGLEQQVEASVRGLLTDRHGREDFTVTTQTQMLDVFGNVMDMVTAGVAAIGGISLLVGSIGILTIMWIAVGERTSEIGLLKALGATSTQVQLLFLAESGALSLAGGALGVGLGFGLAMLARAVVPGLPVHVPTEFVIAALAGSFVTGIVSGVLPARRAASLDPVDALRTD